MNSTHNEDICFGMAASILTAQICLYNATIGNHPVASPLMWCVGAVPTTDKYQSRNTKVRAERAPVGKELEQDKHSHSDAQHKLIGKNVSMESISSRVCKTL